jgi:hypothetical protein
MATKYEHIERFANVLCQHNGLDMSELHASDEELEGEFGMATVNQFNDVLEPITSEEMLTGCEHGDDGMYPDWSFDLIFFILNGEF